MNTLKFTVEACGIMPLNLIITLILAAVCGAISILFLKENINHEKKKH